MLKQTNLVGILNVTPDSFSDGGGGSINPKLLTERLERMLEHNPEVIDIGAASTRPNSNIISAEEEINRFNLVLSTITPIIKNSHAKISIDSYNYKTIEYLLEKFNIDWINDQSGFIDRRMIDLVVNTDKKLVIMHHLTIPTDPINNISEELDVIDEVKNWLLEKADYLMSYGIKKEQIIFDPGIGFNKNYAQSWKLIKEARRLTELGFPVMYGHSRKSFLNSVTNLDFSERDLETSIISLYLAKENVDYLRIHDVKSNSRALKIREYL